MRLVKVKTDRVCSCCEGEIPKGSNAYTYSIKFKGRFWIHTYCKDNTSYKQCNSYKNIKSTLAQRDSVAFDDEGAWLAYNDCIGDYTDECDACDKTFCPYYNGVN